MTRKIIRVNYSISIRIQMLRGRFEATYTSPHQLLVEGHLGLRSCHLREEGRKGLDQVKEAYYNPPSAFDDPLSRFETYCRDRVQGEGSGTHGRSWWLTSSQSVKEKYRKLESKTS
jgi:hypothetical protein